MSVELTSLRPRGDNGSLKTSYENTAYDGDQSPSEHKGMGHDMVKIDVPDHTPEDDFTHYNAYHRWLISTQAAISQTCTVHKTVIWTAIGVVLTLAYLAYFGYAMYYRFGDEGSWRLLGVTVFAVVLFSIVTIGRVYNDQLDQLWDSMQTIRQSNACHRFTVFLNWFLRIGVAVTLVIYVVMDIAIDHPGNLLTVAGLALYIFIFYVTSVNPAKVNWHTVFWGMALQYMFALIILRTKWGFSIFEWLGDIVTGFMEYATAGALFVFGESYEDHFFAMKVMSIVVFFFTVINILFYLGVIQAITRVIGRFLAFCMGTTPAESLNAAANIFLGLKMVSECQTDWILMRRRVTRRLIWIQSVCIGNHKVASRVLKLDGPLLVRPFLKDMTRSELHAIMTSGFATIAGSVLGAYISFGVPANHLISASVMSAPAALAISKLSYPETQKSAESSDDYSKMEKAPEHNIIEAASNGATGSIKMVGSVTVNVLAFLSMLAFLNSSLTWFGNRIGIDDFTFEFICSYVLFPLSYFMGVETADCRKVAELVGVKTFTNEFIAYTQLKNLIANRHSLENYTQFYNTTDWYWDNSDVLLNITGEVLKGGIMSVKSEVIATYALCGFANFGSIGITLGGLGALAPSRKMEISQMVLRAMICGNVACFLTACVAGLLYKPF